MPSPEEPPKKSLRQLVFKHMHRLRRQFSEDYHKARALRSKNLRSIAAIANMMATLQQIFPGSLGGIALGSGTMGANIGAKYAECDKAYILGRPIAGTQLK